MSTMLHQRPAASAGTPNGGVPARRAVFRWAIRLFRQEWRQQLLVLGMLAVAVAATIWGAGVATNTPPPPTATYGTANAMIALPGSDPHLSADIAAIQQKYGPIDLIEDQVVASGTTQNIELRAQDPAGRYGAPLLALDSGRYPSGPGQAALTSQVASLYGLKTGDTWHENGRAWLVTGIVSNPTDLLDEFALVAPGQVSSPDQATILLDQPASASQDGGPGGPGSPAGPRDPGQSVFPGLPASASVSLAAQTGGAQLSPATIVLVIAVLGLVFIGLVSVAGFSVMAQRRLRALGMLSAIGATERNLRLVMISGGLAVGVAGALAGAVLGLAAWFAYVPTLQRASGHVVDAANLPWWALALGVVFAAATSLLASSRPARTMAAVPVVTALSGRPAPPKAVHRAVAPGVIVFAVGIVCLATADGLAGAGGSGGAPALHLVGGLLAVIIGIVLLAPPAISLLRASPRLPVAIRIALRDLVRYRARSGAALAAVTFAAFLATGISVIASIQFENVLAWTGPNLAGSQVIVYALPPQGGPNATPLGSAQIADVSRHLGGLAARLHARPAVALESTGATLHQAGAQAHKDFTGTVYVATPQLLAAYGIKVGQIAPGTDVLTMRPGMASLPRMELTWGNYGIQQGPGGFTQKDRVLPSCTLSGGCLASPVIQTVSSLPGGTSAPNTVITEYAVRKYRLQTQLNGWLIQAPAPLTAAQLRTARQFALAYGATVETASSSVGPGEIADGATALGIVIALGVLAMSVGLIRSEAARDLRTLTAAGASGATRRMITAATAAALGLLGTVLGMAGAVIAGLAWARSSLSVMFGDVPVADVLILVIGLPLIAAASGWLFAGREPPAVARQPID